MGRPRSLKPSYCHDRTTDRAYVVIDTHKRYLGRHGSQESRDLYDRLIGEWIARERRSAVTVALPASATRVTDVVAAFWTQAQATSPAPPHVQGKRPTGELG